MPTKPENIFIVQTAESSRNGRPKGGNISLINKQSALYKYRQQKEQKDSRNSLSLTQTSAPRNSATHRSSWLLESRLSRPTSSSDDALTDGDGSSPEEEQLFVTFREDRPWINEWEFDTDEDARLHNCYAGLRTDPFHAMPIHESSVVLSSSDLCQSIAPFAERLKLIRRRHQHNGASFVSPCQGGQFAGYIS